MEEKGSLQNLWVKTAKGSPMNTVESVSIKARKGIVGNADQRGRRQITILSVQDWLEVESILGHTLDPKIRRANLFIDGIGLPNTKGRTLQVGTARIKIRGETTPCRWMDAADDGLKAALSPDWRGGAYGVALNDATITGGDSVYWT